MVPGSRRALPFPTSGSAEDVRASASAQRVTRWTLVPGRVRKPSLGRPDRGDSRTKSSYQDAMAKDEKTYPYAKRFGVLRGLPETGRPRDEILRELGEMATEEDRFWQTGKCSGTMYCG